MPKILHVNSREGIRKNLQELHKTKMVCGFIIESVVLVCRLKTIRLVAADFNNIEIVQKKIQWLIYFIHIQKAN